MAERKGFREDAADAARLTEQLRAAKEQMRSLQDLADKGAAGEAFADATKKAAANVAALTDKLKELKKLQEAAAKGTGQQQNLKAAEYTSSRTGNFIRKAVESLKEGAAVAKGVASGDAASIDKALGAGGAALEAGAIAATKAAAAIAVAAAGLVVGAVKLGIESTAAADKQRRGLGYLTRGFGESTGKGRGVVQGDIAYRVTLALAGEKGIEPDKALERMRKLIDAKFGREPSELLFRVSADLGEVKGDGRAEEFLGQLEAIKRLDDKVQDAQKRGLKYSRAAEFERGGAQAASLDKFAEAGIRSSEVLGLLAKKGESLQQVSRRLRRGRIDAEEFAKAVATVAGKDVAGAAGKGLDATVNRAKIGLKSLFEGWDLSSIDDLGKKLDEALKSPEGKDLKKSIDEIGAAALRVIQNVSTDDLRSFFTSAASAAHSLAEFIRAASDAASDLVKFGKDTGLIGERAERQRGAHAVDLGDGKVGKHEIAPEKGAEEAGKAFDDGLARGIDANLEKVKAAGARAGDAAAAGSKEALDIHSPSGVGKDIGKNFDKGIEGGIDDHAGGPERAAARVAGRMAGAGAVGGGAGGGESGAAGVTVNAPLYATINLTSASETDLRRLESFLVDFYAAKTLPAIRQAMRDGREQAAGGG